MNAQPIYQDPYFRVELSEGEPLSVCYYGSTFLLSAESILAPLMKRVQREAKEKNVAIEIDLQHVDYLGTSTLSFLLRSLQEIHHAGIPVVLIGNPGNSLHTRRFVAMKILESENPSIRIVTKSEYS